VSISSQDELLMDILWEPNGDAEMEMAITLLTGIAFTIEVPLQSM
jgi:hypothetical protein